ncbi:cache domain-containing protein [Nisaea sediminum]|uniref:cache domain-containing protein n=1 Tax=Nisaea sediminum TaxID=2775867 RepID=UPI0018694964|nr:cache domain-containing protein [Nisaea sediminum]
MTDRTRRRVLTLIAGVATALVCPGIGHAYGTREAVVEMVETAAAAIAANGFPGALEDSPRRAWVRPDEGLYVYVMDESGTLLLHPDKRAEGDNVSGSRDRNGTYFIREIIAATALQPSGAWTLYMWPDPVTGALVPKKTYAKRAGGVIVCAGYAGADV